MPRPKRPAEDGYALVERSESPRSSPFGTPRSLSPNPRAPLLSTQGKRIAAAAGITIFLLLSALLIGNWSPSSSHSDTDMHGNEEFSSMVIQPPRLYLWDIKELEALKRAYREGTAHPSTARAVDVLRKELDPIVAGNVTYTVTSQVMAPVSGDKHDYQSMGYYWWPCNEALAICQKEVPLLYNKPCDPKTGLPWVNCDGHQNKKTKEYSAKLELMNAATQISELSLLYWYTGEEKYAAHAALMARVFFLDPNTNMHPHLTYAQTVPGLEEFDSVIGYGIIEAIQLGEVLEGIALLRLAESPHWSDESDHAPLMQWMAELLHWLMMSAHGNLERHRDNNHGIWFHQTALAIALHVGDEIVATSLANDLPWYIIDRQIQTDGKMPMELERPRPIHYTCYAMTAALRTGRLAKAVGVDIGTHLDSNPRSEKRVNHLQEAVRFVVPYASLKKAFPYPDHDKENQDRHNAGSPWYRCSEALSMALREWGAADPELKAGVEAALLANKDAMWHAFNEFRQYGVPVPLVYALPA